MDDQTEVIKQQMAETRESLADKLETLEQKVIGTVENTTQSVADTVDAVKGAVHDTVETVKGTVHDTVETVRETIDVRQHVDRHPWAMFCGSVALGFIGGYLLTPPRRDSRDPRWPDMHERPGLVPDLPSFSRAEALPPPQRGIQPEPEEPGWFDEVSEKLKPALDRLKQLAIGTSINMIGDMLLNNTPPAMRNDLSGVIDQFTSALGGKPMPHAPPPPVAPEPAPTASRPHNRLAGAKDKRGNGKST